MLFTNATGTGKTFTGLGIIKRFLRQGKGNVLIVTPTDKKNRDWASDAKRLDMEVTPLSGIGDNGGNGVAVTTYANFRQNESLPRRNWDLLVFDESHKISSAEGKVDTLAKKQLDLLGGAKDMPFRRAVEENKSEIRAELGKKDPQFLKYDLERNPESKNPVLTAKIVKDHFDDLSSGLQEKIRDREAELSRCKVLFLSATPFSYHTSLLYADGYLFDIPEKESRGYNQPSGMEDFFITNFGYRMRYNKLTKPDADVDVGVMEREFYEKLRESGAVSGRMLEIDKDYSREFFRVHVCGEILSGKIAGLSSLPAATYLSRMYLIPERESLLPDRFVNTYRSFDSAILIPNRLTYSLRYRTVWGISGTILVLFPFPVIFTIGGASNRISLNFSPATSLTLAPVS